MLPGGTPRPMDGAAMIRRLGSRSRLGLIDRHQRGERAGPLGFAGGRGDAGHVRLDQSAAGRVEEERSRHVLDEDSLSLFVVGQALLGINRSVATLGEAVELLVAIAGRLRKGR